MLNQSINQSLSCCQCDCICNRSERAFIKVMRTLTEAYHGHG